MDYSNNFIQGINFKSINPLDINLPNVAIHTGSSTNAVFVNGPVNYNFLKTLNFKGWKEGSSSNLSKKDEDFEGQLRKSQNITFKSDILKDLRKFENKYNIDSAEFYKKWINGNIEDSEINMIWASLYSHIK